MMFFGLIVLVLFLISYKTMDVSSREGMTSNQYTKLKQQRAHSAQQTNSSTKNNPWYHAKSGNNNNRRNSRRNRRNRLRNYLNRSNNANFNGWDDEVYDDLYGELEGGYDFDNGYGGRLEYGHGYGHGSAMLQDAYFDPMVSPLVSTAVTPTYTPMLSQNGMFAIDNGPTVFETQNSMIESNSPMGARTIPAFRNIEMTPKAFGAEYVPRDMTRVDTEFARTAEMEARAKNAPNAHNGFSFENAFEGSSVSKATDDKYILKSQIVPPVCPACPNIYSQEKKDCPPCPACERCPNPNVDCQRVLNYDEAAEGSVPAPVLTDFSQFAM